MQFLRFTLLPIFVSGVWISVSEFVRNEFLLKSHWNEHYESLGLVFPSEPINGALWGAWSFLFAVAIYLVSRKFNLVQTTFLSWFIGFVLMWLVVFNLDVLPLGILPFAVPLSLLEAFLASLITIKLSEQRNAD